MSPPADLLALQLSFFCYKLATNILICCPISDKMVLSAVSACLIADYLYSHFFVKAVCNLLVSFSLIHFHKSSSTLLHGPLSFACPINENNQRRTCNMYLHIHLDLNLAASTTAHVAEKRLVGTLNNKQS